MDPVGSSSVSTGKAPPGVETVGASPPGGAARRAGDLPLSTILAAQQQHLASLSSKVEQSRKPTLDDERQAWELQLRAAASISNPELRVREEAYVNDKLRKLEKARKSRNDEEQRLREADTKRKQDDARVRGYQASGLYTHALPLKNSAESQAERAFELDLRLSGEATGDSWVKTEHGWSRKTNPVVERKATLSEAELSMQAYEALDLRFGLRRSRSTDFDLAVRCLTALVDIYCVRSARSLQNAIVRDVGVALKTFLRFPQAVDSVIQLLARCRVAFEEIRRGRATAGMPVGPDDERLAQFAQWGVAVDQELAVRDAANATQRAALLQVREHIRLCDLAVLTVRFAAKCASSSAEGPVAWLPAELLLHVFGFLASARDLVRVSAVCSRWYDVGNDEYLYRMLLSNVLPAAELDARMARLQSFKTIYMQVHSRNFVPMTGCFLCANCDALYWAAKGSVGRQCRQVGQVATFDRHQPGVALTPNELNSGLLLAWWRKHKA